MRNPIYKIKIFKKTNRYKVCRSCGLNTRAKEDLIRKKLKTLYL